MIRDTYVNGVFFELGGSPIQVLGPNEKRVALIISPPPVGNYAIEIGQQTTFGQIVIAAGNIPLVLRDLEFGTVIRQPVYALPFVGGEQVRVAEVYER